MSWIGFPVAAGQLIKEWAFLIHFTRALRQRGWAMGNEHSPYTTEIQDAAPRPTSYANAPGYTGIVTSFVASGDNYILTCTGKAWAASRWYDYVDAANPRAPRYYDVVIECDPLNPWGVVRAKIVLANTADTLTVEGGPIRDAVAANQIASVTTPSGKRFCIVRQHSSSHPSLHWNDRWLPWPNAAEYATGLSTVTTTTTLAAAANWTTNDHAGKELMTLAGGRLQRIAIVSNTRDTLTFAARATAPDAGATYAVIDPGAKWAYGRPRPPDFQWYAGYGMYGPTTQSTLDPRYYSHHPDGSLQLANVAAMQIQLSQLDDLGIVCINRSMDAFDRDYWTSIEDECTAPDRPHTPEYHWTFRAHQAVAETISPNFVEIRNHDNLYASSDPAAAIPEFVPATWFKASDVNHVTTTVSTATTGANNFITFPAITLPTGSIASELYGGQRVHYAILDSEGKPVQYGYSFAEGTQGGIFGTQLGTLASATRIDLRAALTGETTYPPAQAVADTWVGKTLVISFGWSRYREREYRYHYDKTVHVSDAAPGPGFYLTRAKSSNYVETTDHGWVADTGIAFVNGNAARYVGDNWADPTTGDPAVGGIAYDTADRDRLFTGHERPGVNREREYGVTTAGSTRSLTCEGRAWTTFVFTETGTATAGTTTSLSDTTKAASLRWDGTTGRYVAFIVEVEIDGIWHRRPVSGHTIGTQTLSWAEPLPVTANAKNYRIREPAELNRWKGRTLRVWVAGERYTIAVTHSDDDTLYFAATVAIPVGAAWQLIEAKPGEVYLRDAGAWIQPTGADARGGTWRQDKRVNTPTIVRRFGRFNRGDLIDYRVMNELYRGINALAWRRKSGNTTSGATNNWRTTQPVPGIVLATVKSTADTEFVNGPPDTYDDNLSTKTARAYKTLRNNAGTSVHAEAASAHYYIEIASADTTRIAHEADAYIYTSTDDEDIGEYDDPDGINPPRPLDPDLGYFQGVPGKMVFSNQGHNVYYRKWSKVSTKAASFDSSDSIKMGVFDQLPSTWPADPATLGTSVENHAAWAMVGLPVVIHRFDVAGGMTYIAPAVAPPSPPAPGAGMSGLFPIVL